MTFDMTMYLKRIGLPRVTIDEDGLRNLQAAQISAIAFENIDPLLGVIPNLAFEAIWNKIVVGKRGGYCFELNALFAKALETCGFQFRPVLARVRMGAPAGGPRSHIAWIVKIGNDEWLADTGFGGPAPMEPIRLGASETQKIRGEEFRIWTDTDSGEDVLQRLNGQEWFSLFGFDRASCNDEDLETANLVCATWEKSPFPFHLMMTVGREDGRNNLFNTDLKRIRNGNVEEESIADMQALMRVLSEDFGLNIGATECARIWDKISMRMAA